MKTKVTAPKSASIDLYQESKNNLQPIGTERQAAIINEIAVTKQA
jgi:hypothetical protein